jgi:hypothetical protein
MINTIGRINIKTGPLTNLIEGGSQPPSWKGKHHSEETKKKISESHKGEKNQWYGKHLSKEHRNNVSKSMKGKNTYKRSEETKKKISESLTGRFVGENSPTWGMKRTEEQKQHHSKIMKGKLIGIKHPKCNKYIYKFIDKNGKIYDNIDRPVLFCKENNICYVSCVAHETYKFRNGWYVERRLK